MAYRDAHPRARQAYQGLMWSLAAVRGDLGVQPEAAPGAEVLQEPKKLRAVARRVYDELVGLEEAQRKIHGPAMKMTPVTQRFPGGYREVESQVRAMCRTSPNERPFGATWTRLARELGSLP
jgi:hypothetical protein